jgi:penicillin-binding protein 2D
VRVRLERAGIPVHDGGYVITTTLDPALQRQATIALVEGTAAVEARAGYRHRTFADKPRGSTDYLQGALVAMDPQNGDVRALIGGRNYQESQFNRATNGVRQPGSTFKPIVYARALLDSIPPSELVADEPLELAYDQQVYRPRNADGEFLGLLTLRQALAKSRNPVAVRLWARLGADSVIALAQRMGLSAPIAPYPSSAIGASVVRPIDLVSAFTAFGNAGVSVEPRFIIKVEDPAGRSVHGEAIRFRGQAMDSSVAFVARELMREAVESGTATAVRRYIPASIPVAGKTGTTDDNTDVWFVGITSQIVAGVWLGFDKPRTITPGAAGGTLAAPIFGQMLARWRGLSTDPWIAPSGVVSAELDRETGSLAEPETPIERRYTEYFVAGTEPAALRIDARRLFRAGPLIGF